MSHYKHMNKNTKQNKRNWHIACCSANKASLSTTLQSCELFIPTPAQFSGTSGSCTQFLFPSFWPTMTDVCYWYEQDCFYVGLAHWEGGLPELSLIYRGNSPVGHAYLFFFFTSEMTKVLTVPYIRESITLPPSKDKVNRGLLCQRPHSGRWVRMGRTHTPWDFSAWIMSGAGQRVGVARRIRGTWGTYYPHRLPRQQPWGETQKADGKRMVSFPYREVIAGS